MSIEVRLRKKERYIENPLAAFISEGSLSNIQRFLVQDSWRKNVR